MTFYSKSKKSEKTVNGMHCITEAIHLIISNIIPFLNGPDLHLIIRKEKMEYLCSMLQCLFYRYVQVIVCLFSSQILQKATKGTVSRLSNSSQPLMSGKVRWELPGLT